MNVSRMARTLWWNGYDADFIGGKLRLFFRGTRSGYKIGTSNNKVYAFTLQER